MKRYYLSVDGGGSFTEMCVADEHGQVLFTLTGGSTSFKSVGNPTAFANLRELARQLEIRGIRPDELICGVWGMSGCDTPEDQMVYEALIQQAGFRMDNARVMNDAMLSYRAAAEGAGIVIIAGTGSVVMGLDSQRGIHRIGGWNYSFTDLGSGYWMGSELLRETALWLDGCREEEPAFRSVCAKLSPDGAPAEQLLFKLSTLTGADEIAAFARIVMDAENSPLCETIRDKAIGHLCRYASAMLARLEARGERDLKIVLAGGLFHNASFRDKAVAAMEKLGGACVICNSVSPTLGGIKIALHMM